MATETVANDGLATMDDYAAAEFTALLSHADMKELESIAKEWGVTRRLGLGVLTRDKSQLLESFDNEESAAAMMTLHDSLRDYADFLRGQIEAMEMAGMRLLAAGAAAIRAEERK
jgi:hypothetical protein